MALVRKYIGVALLISAWVPAWALGPAGELLEQNRLKEALVLCQQFTALPTPDKENLWDCGWVFYHANQLEAAEKVMDRLRADYANPKYKLLLAMGLIKKKQFDQANEITDLLVNTHKGTPIEVKARELSALGYEEKGNIDAAAFIYKQLVGDNPKLARAQWGLGRYYLSRGDLVRAKTHLSETTKLWPKHMGSRFNLAVLALNQDNLGDAAKWLTECYKLNKTDPGVLEQLGVLFEKKGKLEEAVKYWQKALDLSKDSPIAKKKLAVHFIKFIDLLIEEKKPDAALQQIESNSALSAVPEVALRRGIIYRLKGKFEKALAELLDYEKRDAKSALLYRELGICYVNLELHDKAEPNFSRAIELEPNNGMNYAWLAYALEGQKEYERAREAWQKAVDLLKDPTELAKATRKLASIQKRVEKKAKGRDAASEATPNKK